MSGGAVSGELSGDVSGWFGEHAGARGNIFCADQCEGESGDREHVDVVFARRQLVSSVGGGFESPIQQWIFSAWRLYICESSGRRRFVECDNFRRRAGAGVKSL